MKSRRTPKPLDASLLSGLLTSAIDPKTLTASQRRAVLTGQSWWQISYGEEANLMVAEIFPKLPVIDEGAQIGPLALNDSVGAVEFIPEQDITALEAVLISQLFTRLTMHGVNSGAMAWRAYLQRNMLMRHFEPVMKGKG